MSEPELLTIDNDYYIDLKESLDRLVENQDFKKVILEGYLKTKALGLVNLLARDDIKKQNKRVDCMEELVGISSLNQYFKMICYMGSKPTEKETDIPTDKE